jgi:hypothetical protein
VPPSLAEQIRGSLNASRREADRLLVEAEARTRALSERAAGVERNVANAQLVRLRSLRAELDAGQERIDSATVRLVETMAATSIRLVEAARDADFSIPPWPGGIGRTVEIKLSETREVTFRFATGQGSAGPEREGI